MDEKPFYFLNSHIALKILKCKLIEIITYILQINRIKLLNSILMIYTAFILNHLNMH